MAATALRVRPKLGSPPMCRLNISTYSGTCSTTASSRPKHSKCYNPETPTRDRLQHPMLRVGGKLERISWDDAFEIFAQVSHHVLERHGVHAWAMKKFSYQYFENTYALSKLAFRSIATPAYADHDNPTKAPSVPGLRDAGIEKFSAS